MKELDYAELYNARLSSTLQCLRLVQPEAVYIQNLPDTLLVLTIARVVNMWAALASLAKKYLSTVNPFCDNLGVGALSHDLVANWGLPLPLCFDCFPLDSDCGRFECYS